MVMVRNEEPEAVFGSWQESGVLTEHNSLDLAVTAVVDRQTQNAHSLASAQARRVEVRGSFDDGLELLAETIVARTFAYQIPMASTTMGAEGLAATGSIFCSRRRRKS